MHIPLIAKLAASALPYFGNGEGSSSRLSDAGNTASTSSSTLTFRPIHAHAHTWADDKPALVFHNATAHASEYIAATIAADDGDEDTPNASVTAQPLSIRTRRQLIRRPKIRPPRIISWAVSAQSDRRRRKGLFPFDDPFYTLNTTETWVAPDFNDHSASGGWEDVEVDAPDITDRQTLITLAKMASNAYVLPDGGEWWPTGDFNATIPFGWETGADGLRGHVFADSTNSTVIISIKGTSAGVLGVGGPTAKNDKYNDNLMFSCCCARVDFSWSTVCDCYAGGYRCEQTCLEDALVSESVYATVGTNLYNNVTYMYPNATIWLTGHSLGGSVSALIGLSFGAPAVTLEAPGDLLPAKRLHLPLPPGVPAEKSGITHIYHTADPIPMGLCTGAYSGCYAAGFAMESKCHTGQTILYDTVTVKGWSVDIRTHRIGEVINKVLADPWPTNDEPEHPDPKDPKDPQDPKDPKKKPKTPPPGKGDEHQPSNPGSPGDGGGGDDEEDGPPDDPWFGWITRWGWPRKGPKGGEGDGDDEDGGKGGGGWERHGGVPKAKPEDPCVDCFKWEFGDGWNEKPKKLGRT